jgi:hypothetical protein
LVKTAWQTRAWIVLAWKREVFLTFLLIS